ncbi:type II toxin-antitoxin system RelE/ParE family toxin [Myxacorys almedinensis]|uniref:Type II toxin-antitoxin system RelE/ParE family toxin n=1 Tax=Myxacorys almedinensis A TaxID=2690445 RepID=A0A8J8CIZ4_9CYAN|nr:type II toxin-antitoxin system RelE/ParE family toxin [Myxacorys almedinensis]NDJ17061.1 type II toxin-antitoxin system RelE/ParE family toxin [Myxacorys almedinensis A]
MSDSSEALVQLTFTDVFKRRLKGLAKRYRRIKTDIQPILDCLLLGDFIGEQIPETKYAVYKARARNSDAQSGKSGGYRLIYQITSPSSVILHLIYSKSDQATISAKEIQDLIETYQGEKDSNASC